MDYRIEKDLLGEKRVPSDAYWGIHTQRAQENFRLSGYRVSPPFIQALAMVKKACVRTNAQLQYIPSAIATAIEQACDEIEHGALQVAFPIDALQGGAGTSTNMNINEVIANRALEIMGKHKGDYASIHPVQTVNLHQSTNDVYPTALKIASLLSLKDLSREIEKVQAAFQRKEQEYSAVLALGRTELQPAVPMTFGAQFSSFAEAFARDRWRVFKCEERLRTVNLGGTAVGTGLCAPRKYIFDVIEQLRDITGLNLSRSENAVDQTANSDSFVEVSGILKAHAQNLIKICGDIRLLNMLGELTFASVQAGSSIMPGKVNPVILEAAIQVGIKTIANDLVVTECASRGSLQINEFLPLLGFALLESILIMTTANTMLASFVDTFRVDVQRCQESLKKSTAIITAFVPVIGYERAQDLVKEFGASGKVTLREFLVEQLGTECVEKTLSAQNLLSMGYR